MSVTSLDSIDTKNVRFIKIDVEGTELDVLDGARRTIARDRPLLLMELLAGAYADSTSSIEKICRTYGYDAAIVDGDE
ncbi:FkbM family methyltransferase, partial [Bacillus sp. SIMBA_161]